VTGQGAFFSSEQTLKQAREEFFRDLSDGIPCPCCHRYGKAYKRKLNAGMAAMLIGIYRIAEMNNPEHGWIHVSKYFLKRRKNAVANEYSKLRFWDLIEEKPGDDETVPGTGLWKITQQGKQFVRGDISVPRHVIIYANSLIGTSDELTTIKKSLGDKFDYYELMGWDPR